MKNKEKNKEKSKFYENSKLVPLKPKTEDWDYYKDLKALEWKSKRLKILDRDGYKCVRCGSTKNLQVHHIKYLFGHKPWEYSDELLITLCRECHYKEHHKNLWKELKGGQIIQMKAWECLEYLYTLLDYDIHSPITFELTNETYRKLILFFTSRQSYESIDYLINILVKNNFLIKEKEEDTYTFKYSYEEFENTFFYNPMKTGKK